MKEIAWYSPWPPTPNGIADYSYRVTRELVEKYRVVAYTDMNQPRLPPGVQKQAVSNRQLLENEVCPVYQIGNNLDHIFVLKAAFNTPGIVVLHDLSLLYLFENLGFDEKVVYAELVKSNSVLAPLYARRLAFGVGSYKSDHSLFRMLNTLVERSKLVVVHTRYAERILLRTLGSQVAHKIRVIPHFAITPDAAPRGSTRSLLGIPKDAFLVVTSGFATNVKRFDWLIESLDRVAKMNGRLMWVQAGPTRPDEYDLERLVAQRPDLARITRFTGYLPEDTLDSYISAADLFVNLRYPSVGESSGSLARALATGVACVVTNTAGYREFPSSVLYKVSPDTAATEIEELILRGILDSTTFDKVRQSARQFAQNELSITRYIEKFELLLNQSASLSCEPSPASIFSESVTRLTKRLGPFALNELEFGSLEKSFPESEHGYRLGVRKEASGWYIEVMEEA